MGAEIENRSRGGGNLAYPPLIKLKINLLIKIKIKWRTEAEKSLPKPPSRTRNSLKKLIGANLSISNITKCLSSI